MLCLLVLVCRCAVIAVGDGVIEEEDVFGGQHPEPEYEGQYREPVPEDPYREQELSEGFEDGKFNLIL